MNRAKLRAFLAASAIPALAVLDAGSAIGQQSPVEIPSAQVQQLLKGFGFITPNGDELCHDARPVGSTPKCMRDRVPPGCTCFSTLNIKGFARIDADGKVNLEFQGLAPALSKEIMKKAGAPAVKQ